MRLTQLLARAATLAAFGAVLAPVATAETNPDTLAQFTAVVDEMAAKYQLGPIPVVVGDLRQPDPAIGDMPAGARYGDEIILTPKYAAMSRPEFDTATSYSRSIGFHAPGCDALRTIAIHETGHIIDARSGYGARERLTRAVDEGQLVNDGMPKGMFLNNGAINTPEALAIAFQAVECGSATPSTRRIYDILMGAE